MEISNQRLAILCASLGIVASLAAALRTFSGQRPTHSSTPEKNHNNQSGVCVCVLSLNLIDPVNIRSLQPLIHRVNNSSGQLKMIAIHTWFFSGWKQSYFFIYADTLAQLLLHICTNELHS